MIQYSTSQPVTKTNDPQSIYCNYNTTRTDRIEIFISERMIQGSPHRISKDASPHRRNSQDVIPPPCLWGRLHCNSGSIISCFHSNKYLVLLVILILLCFLVLQDHQRNDRVSNLSSSNRSQLSYIKRWSNFNNISTNNVETFQPIQNSEKFS